MYTHQLLGPLTKAFLDESLDAGTNFMYIFRSVGPLTVACLG